MQQSHLTITAHQPSQISQCSTLTNVVAAKQGTDLSAITTRRQDRLTKSKTSETVVYWGFCGSIRVRRKAKFLKDRSSWPEEAVSRETCIFITPTWIRKVFELRYRTSLGQLTRTLTYYPVLPLNAKVFSWCYWGEIEELKNALSCRRVSPLVRDDWGCTLLHKASTFAQSEICSLLIQLGVDADHTDVSGWKASHLVGTGYGRQPVDVRLTMRLLTMAQDDITADDVEKYCQTYSGPAEGAEVFLAACVHSNPFIYQSDEACFFLGLALRWYGRGDRGWVNLIQRLLREGVDIHANISPSTSEASSIVKYLRPLDELFREISDPFDTNCSAREWLCMLSEAGYDVNDYLEEEIVLHSPSNFLTYQIQYLDFVPDVELPRQLVFNMGVSPDISWDWWVDPASPASLVRQEYRHINFNTYTSTKVEGITSEWKINWPFAYSYGWTPPELVLPRDVWDEMDRRLDQAQNRFDCWWQKKHRKTNKGKFKQTTIPGSWVEDNY